MRSRIAVAVVCGLVSCVVVAWATTTLVNPIADKPARWKAVSCEGQQWEILFFVQASQSCVSVARHDPTCIAFSDPVEKGNPEDVVPAWMAEDVRLCRIDGGSNDSLISVASGWPFPCLWNVQWSQNQTGVDQSATRGGFAIPGPPWEAWPGLRITTPFREPVAVPTISYRPLWGGLFGDTLLYSAAWFAMFASIVSIRKMRLIRRGLCVECGYSLVGLNGHRCPECGANIARSASRSGA